jgi:hypothetical protein
MPRSHLKDLMSDQVRIESLIKEDLGLYIDFSRQRMTQDTLKVRGGFVCLGGWEVQYVECVGGGGGG